MKRIVLKLVLFLLLGAILNVTIAWGLNVAPHTYATGMEKYLGEDDVLWWRTNAPAGFPAEPAGSYETRRIGRRMLLLYEWTEANGTLGDNAGRFQFGLPFLSMESAMWVSRKSRTVVQQSRFMIPSNLPLGGHWVPTKPVWMGFVTNTVLYAGVLWVGLTFSGSWRRRHRIKRGLCPACGYPVGDSAVCTECGKAVKA
jgi:hypothetical protein